MEVKAGGKWHEVIQPVHPIPCPCSTYLGEHGGPRDRCTEQATHWLIQPNGDLNPGGYVCEKHGRAVVEEFRVKLQEQWALVEISRG